MKRSGNSFYKIGVVLGIFVLCFSVFGGFVFAETDYDSKIEDKEKEKSAKESELEQSKKNQYSYEQEGLTIGEKITALESDLAGLEGRLKAEKKELSEIEEKVEKKAEEQKKSQDKVYEISKTLYKFSQINAIELLLSAEGLTDLIKRIGIIKYGADHLVAQLRKYQESLAEVSAEYNMLSDDMASLEKELQQLAEDKVALENQKRLYEQMAVAEAAKQNQLVNDIVGLIDDIDQLSDAAEEAMNDKTGGGDPGGSGGGNSGGGSSPQDPMGDPGKYDIYKNGSKVASKVSGPIRVVPNSASYFSVDGGIGRYRGILEMRADTNVYIINELDFELYLRGIGEIPSSWPSEALKSQVLAARTYAAANWNKRQSYGYNLRDDTYDQNYVGYGKEIASGGSRWVSAVKATSGKTIYAGSSLISAYYHSTCGGHTLSSQEVWGGARSYAKAESDWYESGGLKSYDKASPWSYKRWCGSSSSSCTSAEKINDTKMIDLLNASLYLAVNPNSPTRQDNVRRSDLGGYTASQIVDALGEGNTITDLVGDFQKVESVYNAGGTSIASGSRKTSKLRVTGSSGTHEVEAGVFWVVFNVRAPGDAHIFYSNFWTAKKESGSWNFYSRGYPHRVGMCQYGAYGRAQAGQSYQDIIGHYYRGTTIKNFSPPANFRVGLTKVGGPTTVFAANGSFDVYAEGQKEASGSSGQSWKVVKR